MAVDTIIWDLDGTLYDDERVYDRYAEELASFLPRDRRTQYLRDWTAAKAGRGVACIGLGYDERRDRLFRFAGDDIVCFIDWSGQTEPGTAYPRGAPGRDAREDAQPRTPVVEVPIFGDDRFNIGDLWGLPDALAAHYGVARAERNQAFLATRAYMSSDAYCVQPEPRLHAVLDALTAAGKCLVAMSNSPAASVLDLLDRLGIHECFALVVPSALKPAGLGRFMAEAGAAERILSIGDNFVNDVEPALRAGSHALYIDRHSTGLGVGLPRCYHVASIQAALDWVAGRLLPF